MKRIKLEKVIHGDLVFYIDTVNSEIPRVTLRDRRRRYSSLTIPSEITHNGKIYKVEPSDYSFSEVGRCKIDELILSEGIEYTGLGFFRGSDYLVTLILPRSLKIVGDLSFYNCTKLKKVIYYETPEIGYYAFRNTPFLMDYVRKSRSLVVYFGKSIVYIDRYVESLVVEEGTKYICDDTNPCKYVSKLYLPKSVVRADLFIQESLKSIHVEDLDSFLDFINRSDIDIKPFFTGSIELYLKDKKVDTFIIKNPTQGGLCKRLPIPLDIKNYILDSDINFIDLDYFKYQYSVTEIYFPETIKTLWGSVDLKYNGQRYDKISLSIDGNIGPRSIDVLNLREGTDNIEIAYNEEYYSRFLSARFISSNYEPRLNIKLYLIDQRKENRERFFNNITTICNRVDTRVIFNSLEVDSWALDGFDEYFIENSKLPLGSKPFPIIDELFVPGNLVKEFNKSFWSIIAKHISPIEYKNRFSIKILDSGDECIITYLFKDGKNNYPEIVYIPQYIQYEGAQYKVVGIDNIAFTESNTRNCIIPGNKDFIIEPFAFFDCHPDLKIRKVLVD